MKVFLRAWLSVWAALGPLARSHPAPEEVRLDFLTGPVTWFGARSVCEERGGELLRVIQSPEEASLRNILVDQRLEEMSGLTFWLGEIQGPGRHLAGAEQAGVSTCRYMKLNPLRFSETSDCNRTRGFVCSYSLQKTPHLKGSSGSRCAARPREKRQHGSEVDTLLLEAEREMLRLETGEERPAGRCMDGFIKNLLQTTKNLTPAFVAENNETVGRILNCSSGILSLCTGRCDVQTNPDPRSLFGDIFEILQTISALQAWSSQEDVVMTHSSGTIYQTSRGPSALGGAVLGSPDEGPFVKLPSYAALRDRIGGSEKVTVQLVTFSDNPHPTDEDVPGPVCSLSLRDRGSDIELADLDEELEIVLPRVDGLETETRTPVLEEKSKVLIRFNVSDPDAAVVLGVQPSANVSLVLGLANGSASTSGPVRNTTVLDPGGSYRWVIGPDVLQQISGTCFIHVQVPDSSWVPNLTLTIQSFMIKCLFWDEERELWSGEGCRVGQETSAERTQCLCDHLTLFGRSFIVMPNYVDVARTADLFGTVSENFVVLALLCCFFGLYLTTLLWALLADRRAFAKKKTTLLEDNHPCAQYNYLISVQTGHRKNAGTTANVTLKLIGSEAGGDAQVLHDPRKAVLERGGVDVFLMAAPFPLGEELDLRLQHDDSGAHPSWYVNKVTVQDLQTRHVWYFLCDCWLSSNRGDGLTKRTFYAARSSEVASFRNIFQSRTWTGFRDEHIWVSVVDPPSRSPFTRVQRVSCCMSLLLCTMAINIAFWNIPIDEDSPELLSFGSLQITWQDVMVAVESGLLMFPINVLIVTIFRSIRPRVPSSKRGVSEESRRPKSVTVAMILKETEEVISWVSRSQRNMMRTCRLESISDLLPALDGLHGLIHLIQGQVESNLHWLFCSKFLLAALRRLLMCLEELDEKNFPGPQEYRRALDVTRQLVLKADMVFSSHLAGSPTPINSARRSSGRRLPWWFVFLGWFLLLSISGVSTFFTLLYGFEYGKAKSIKWVMSLGLSLFQSIFILQPLKVVGVAVFFALLLKPVATEETEEVEQALLEQQNRCRRFCGP